MATQWQDFVATLQDIEIMAAETTYDVTELHRYSYDDDYLETEVEAAHKALLIAVAKIDELWDAATERENRRAA